MHPDRRRVLAVIAGAAILAAQPPRARADAFRPWVEAGSVENEPRRRALSWAVLAPSPHNRQPWLVALEGDDAVTLFCDLDRRLPQTDPFDRQVTLGLGGFLELFVMAAAEQGLGATVALFPEGEPWPRLDGRPIARLRLAPGATPDPLFAAVLDRRSNKSPYDMARIPTEADIAALAAAPRHGSAAAGATRPEAVAAIRDLAIAAMELELATPRLAMESVDLLRIGRREVDAQPDGVDLLGPQIEALAAKGVLTREAFAAEIARPDFGAAALRDPTRPLMAQMAGYALAPMAATPAYLWQTTTDASRAGQLNAGRDWLRLNLAATAMGLAIHPQSQALQEYPEMAGFAARMRAATGSEGATLQMLARLGYAPNAPASPRWPAETRIL